MTLHLYLARRLAVMCAAVTGGFAALVVVIETLKLIAALPQASVGQAAQLALLGTPAWLYDILPLIVLLASVMLFVTLARASELVVIRAAGRSALRALVGPGLLVAGLSVLAVAIGNPIVATTLKRQEAMQAQLGGQSPSTSLVSGRGIWLRQAAQDGQAVIHGHSANLDGTELFGVSILTYDAQGLPHERIDARSAALGPTGWTLHQAKRWPLQAANPEASADLLDHLVVPSQLTADRIRDSFGTPASISIWNLPDFIARLSSAGFSAKRHQAWLHREIAQPVFLLAMLLIGAGFTMRRTRSRRAGAVLAAAMVMGFVLYFLRRFALILGENGQISVALAAWPPPVAALLLALAVLLHKEDG